MGLIVKISARDKPEDVRKALAKLAIVRGKKKRPLMDFYGALPSTYKDGLNYQQEQRHEWQ